MSDIPETIYPNVFVNTIRMRKDLQAAVAIGCSCIEENLMKKNWQ